MPVSTTQQTNIVTLQFLQNSTFDSSEVLLATLKFSTTDSDPFGYKGKSGEQATIQISKLPFGFSVEAFKPLSNIIRISFESNLKLVDFKQEIGTSHMVRSVGGKKYNAEPNNLKDKRGGYEFATLDKETINLVGKGGIISEEHILSLAVILNKNYKQYRIPLLFPTDPYQNNIYDNISFDVALKFSFGSDSWSTTGPHFDFDAYEFISDSSVSVKDLKANLTTEYGDPSKHVPIQARDYSKYVTGANQISIKFVEYLSNAVAFVNSKIPAAATFSLTSVEVACTFLCEGGCLKLNDAINNNTPDASLFFSGYQDIGIDSYVSAWKKNAGIVRLLTIQSLQDKIHTPSEVEKITNEQNDTFETFRMVDFKDAVYAVAALYANAKYFFSNDLADANIMGAWTCDTSDLPLHLQHFWTTLYFNTGPGRGKAALHDHGLEYHDIIWRQEDNEIYNKYEKYNCNWRTATFRLLDIQMTH